MSGEDADQFRGRFGHQDLHKARTVIVLVNQGHPVLYQRAEQAQDRCMGGLICECLDLRSEEIVSVSELGSGAEGVHIPSVFLPDRSTQQIP